MLKGNIYVLTDPSMVMGLAATHTIICVSGETHNYQDFIMSTNASVASILIPSYEATMAEMDGNMQAFRDLYFAHLSKKEPSNFIAIILRALYNGRNIILYLTPDEAKLSYIRYLMEYFRLVYGVTIGYESIPCSFDINYTGVVLNTLFMYELMSPTEFLEVYPLELQLDPMAITKLSNIICPYVEQHSIEAYRDYFDRYRRNLKSNPGCNIIPICSSKGVI